MTASGLLDYVYTGPTDRWPTLGEMIAGNQRVVMLAQDDAGNVPWYHKGYDGPLRETPYDFRGDFGTTRDGISELTEPGKLNESCRPLRGGDNGALFLMNHWVNGSLDNTNKVAPDPEVARILNRKDVLVNRALACKQRRGIMPTLVAVDDFGEGDLIGAVRELNGVVAEPFLETTRPKPAVVRAGRRAVLRVPVSNFGDADGKVKVCAKVPRRLAKKPRCSVVEVAIGATTTARINIWTKRRAKGKGKVSLTLRTTGDSVSTATNLKGKPKPKKIKRKKRR